MVIRLYLEAYILALIRPLILSSILTPQWLGHTNTCQEAQSMQVLSCTHYIDDFILDKYYNFTMYLAWQ